VARCLCLVEACLHRRCQKCRGRSLNDVHICNLNIGLLCLSVTASGKEIFLFLKTPRPALGPTYRPSSLGTGVICRSYSCRGVKLTILVPRLRIIGAVPSLRLSTGWTVQRGRIFRTRPNRPRGPSVLSLGVKRPERGVYHLAPRLKNGYMYTSTPLPLSASVACLG
jgi:hypothetical protein